MTAEKKNVFIVDDDVSICRSLSYYLTSFGFDVSAFYSAPAYFSSVLDHMKGSLILDIHLPEYDGWDVLKRVMESRIKRPVIVITADKNGSLKERALGIGAVGFFQKPINGQDLVDLIYKTYETKGVT
jgi:two-component system response regulator TtrR